MSPLADSETSLTLMEMLREDPRNAVAWDRFVRRYYPKIYRWCRSWGLQEADAEDVAQDVIAKLTQKMASFRYDESRCFRAWLKTITQRVLSDLMASRRRAVGDQAIPLFEIVEARAELERRIAEILDRELLDLAISKSAPEGRAGDVGRLSPHNLRRIQRRRSVAVARYARRLGFCVQASRAKTAQGRDSQAGRAARGMTRRRGLAWDGFPIRPT